MGKALSLLARSFVSTIRDSQVSHPRILVLFDLSLLLASSNKHVLLILVKLIYQFGFIALALQNTWIFCSKAFILWFLIICAEFLRIMCWRIVFFFSCLWNDASVLVGNNSPVLMPVIKILFLMIRWGNTDVSLANVIVLLSLTNLICCNFYLLSTRHRRIGGSFEVFIVSLFVNMHFRFNQLVIESHILLFVLIIFYKSLWLGSQAIIRNNRAIWDGRILETLHFGFGGFIGYFIQIAHLSLTLDAVGDVHAAWI